MKHSAIALLMILMCCIFCPQSSYAIPALTKDCPECVGGRVENWYGGYSPCENCGGDGRVTNWVGVGFAVFLGIAFVSKVFGGKQ